MNQIIGRLKVLESEIAFILTIFYCFDNKNESFWLRNLTFEWQMMQYGLNIGKLFKVNFLKIFSDVLSKHDSFTTSSCKLLNSI